MAFASSELICCGEATQIGLTSDECRLKLRSMCVGG